MNHLQFRRITTVLFSCLATVCPAVWGNDSRFSHEDDDLRNNGDKKIAELTKRIQSSPNDAKLFSNRARLYLDSYRDKEALRDYSEAIRLDPKYDHAYKQRALIYGSLNKYDLALKDYDMMLKHDPKNCTASLDKALCLQAMKKDELALEELNRAEKLGCGRMRLYEIRASLFAAMGKNDRALADYDVMIRKNPNSDGMRMKKIDILNKQGKINLAIKECTSIMSHGPEQAEIFEARGQLYLKTAQYKKAIDDFSKAIEMEPKMREALAGRATAYERLGDKVKAEKDRTTIQLIRKSSNY